MHQHLRPDLRDLAFFSLALMPGFGSPPVALADSAGNRKDTGLAYIQGLPGRDIASIRAASPL